MTVLITYDGFPNSIQEPFIKTSCETDKYNCIAHAVGNDKDWYEPNPDPAWLCYWPKNIPFKYTVEAYLMVFESIGYTKCDNGELEEGYTKIAFFYAPDRNRESFHAARQLPDGLWSSKLGENIDVSHTMKAISNGSYGEVIQYLKKPN